MVFHANLRCFVRPVRDSIVRLPLPLAAISPELASRQNLKRLVKNMREETNDRRGLSTRIAELEWGRKKGGTCRAFAFSREAVD